ALAPQVTSLPVLRTTRLPPTAPGPPRPPQPQLRCAPVALPPPVRAPRSDRGRRRRSGRGPGLARRPWLPPAGAALSARALAPHTPARSPASAADSRAPAPPTA